MINRIYEIKEGFSIDLKRVIAIRQFIDIEGEGRNRYQKCWFEIYMDCDQIVVVDCTSIEELEDLYGLTINAWQSYANEEPII